MTKLKNDYESALRVNITDRAQVFPAILDQHGQLDFENLKLASRVDWHNPGLNQKGQPEEFKATPIDDLDLPKDFGGFAMMHSQLYERANWYFLERIAKTNGLANEYVVHGDNLIPLNVDYPALISSLPHLQELLALAQLEAAKLAQHSPARLGEADRLMVYLTTIAVNFAPR